MVSISNSIHQGRKFERVHVFVCVFYVFVCACVTLTTIKTNPAPTDLPPPLPTPPFAPTPIPNSTPSPPLKFQKKWQSVFATLTGSTCQLCALSTNALQLKGRLKKQNNQKPTLEKAEISIVNDRGSTSQACVNSPFSPMTII